MLEPFSIYVSNFNRNINFLLRWQKRSRISFRFVGHLPSWPFLAAVWFVIIIQLIFFLNLTFLHFHLVYLTGVWVYDHKVTEAADLSLFFFLFFPHSSYTPVEVLVALIWFAALSKPLCFDIYIPLWHNHLQMSFYTVPMYPFVCVKAAKPCMGWNSPHKATLFANVFHLHRGLEIWKSLSWAFWIKH